MSKTKKVALVISGGGAKGAFAVGVIKHLFLTYRDQGWFSIVGGTSTGALIAPMAALMAAPEPTRTEAFEALLHFYTNVSTSDILEKQNLFELMQRQDCLYESDPLNNLIHQQFRPDWFVWLQRPEAPDCYVVYTNYQTGEKVVASPKDPGMHRERFIQTMLASASVPVIMEATMIAGDACYDGGVRDLLPFGHAIRLGAEVIVPIFLNPEGFSTSHSRFRRMDKILLRTLDILVDETGKNDFALANLINIAIQAKQQILRALNDDPVILGKIQAIFAREAYRALFGPEKRLLYLISGLRPDRPLTEDSLSFDPAKMRLWMDWGEQKAAQIIMESPFGQGVPGFV